MSRQQDFFTETAVTPERKVEKSFPRWEINRHAEGLKWTKNRDFGPKKRRSLLGISHVLATPGKSCSKKKVAFAQIIITQNIILGDFLG